MASVTELLNQLIEYLNQGKFAEGIEDFYHEGVVAQENSNEPSRGREGLAANEKKFLSKVTAYHGTKVHATAIDDQGDGSGTVLYEATMSWDRPTVRGLSRSTRRWSSAGVMARSKVFASTATLIPASCRPSPHPARQAHDHGTADTHSARNVLKFFLILAKEKSTRTWRLSTDRVRRPDLSTECRGEHGWAKCEFSTGNGGASLARSTCMGCHVGAQVTKRQTRR